MYVAEEKPHELHIRTDSRMPDLHDPRLMYLKVALFVAIGVIASAVLLLKHPSVEAALLLGLAIWAFCRAYYFAFYVIEHYIDDGFRYSGLRSFVRHVLRKKRTGHHQ